LNPVNTLRVENYNRKSFTLVIRK